MIFQFVTPIAVPFYILGIMLITLIMLKELLRLSKISLTLKNSLEKELSTKVL